MILPPVENELHTYLGGICNDFDHQVVKVGGFTDHVHILCHLSKKVPLIKLMAAIKSNSSKWIKTKGETYENFFWQDGYDSFSVSPHKVDLVARYIENQHEHHSKVTFKKEYITFLEKYGVVYDERYVWD